MVKTIHYPQTKQYMQSLLKYTDAAQDIRAAKDFLMQTRVEMLELEKLLIDPGVAPDKFPCLSTLKVYVAHKISTSPLSSCTSSA
jgi:hypothetical protein